MISKKVSSFIEGNVDLLESDLRAFLAKSRWTLNSADSEELISVLRDASIYADNILEELLLKHLDFVFPTIHYGTSLTQFVSFDLITVGGNRKTYYGMTYSELLDFILDNQDRFADDVSIVKDFQGMYILEEPKYD